MSLNASQLAQKLSVNAEAVCEYYLPNGKRMGRYWIVGDVMNSPGKSLHVRLTGPTSGPGAAGKWSDEATGDHGDLLDLIRINRQLDHFTALRDEVLRFLSEPAHLTRPVRDTVPKNSSASAKRLFASAKPVHGTVAATYLASRGLTFASFPSALRFHPSCFYRPDARSELQKCPALLAAVTNGAGDITGLLRTYLARDGSGKAPFDEPRLALGDLNGNAVRFGEADEALVIGEGLETMLSVKLALPFLPVTAALTANHLTAFTLPKGLRRLYIAADNDTAGLRARDALANRAAADAIAVYTLLPIRDDWNTVLQCASLDAVTRQLESMLMVEDRQRFPVSAAG